MIPDRILGDQHYRGHGLPQRKGAHGDPYEGPDDALSRGDLVRQRKTGQRVARLLWRVRQTLLCRTPFSGTLTREIADAIDAAHTQGLLP